MCGGIIQCDIAVNRAHKEHLAGRQQGGGQRIDCRNAGRRKRVCFRVVHLGCMYERPFTGNPAYDQDPSVLQKHRLVKYAVELQITGF